MIILFTTLILYILVLTSASTQRIDQSQLERQQRHTGTKTMGHASCNAQNAQMYLGDRLKKLDLSHVNSNIVYQSLLNALPHQRRL